MPNWWWDMKIWYKLELLEDFFRTRLGWSCCQLGQIACPIVLVAQMKKVIEEFHFYSYFWNPWIKKISKTDFKCSQDFLLQSFKPCTYCARDRIISLFWNNLGFQSHVLLILNSPPRICKICFEKNWSFCNVRG